jgi:hypothetical protein
MSFLDQITRGKVQSPLRELIYGLPGVGKSYFCVVDSLDWLEPLIHEDVCTAKRVSNIADIPYGGGYQECDNRWRKFFTALEWLQREKGMHVLLIAHSKVKTKREPNGDEYDTFTMKMSERANGICIEWCNSVLFAHYDVQTKTDKMTKKKLVSNGARVLHCETSPGIVAKNRYGLPVRVAMDFSQFKALIDKSYE